jgi:hypothetical protein
LPFCGDYGRVCLSAVCVCFFCLCLRVGAVAAPSHRDDLAQVRMRVNVELRVLVGWPACCPSPPSPHRTALDQHGSLGAWNKRHGVKWKAEPSGKRTATGYRVRPQIRRLGWLGKKLWLESLQEPNLAQFLLRL